LLYADKTAYILELIKDPDQQFFLSRPRRFGKSLLLSSMKSLFLGQKELFKGLAIAAQGYDFPKFPVLTLSMVIGSKTPSILETGLLTTLRSVAKEENIEIMGSESIVCFRELIKALYLKNDRTKVVVLVDEYDFPVTSTIADQKTAEANAAILSGFFAVLKDMDEFIRFAFVTGITRYALTSMDSGPNHLSDISLDPKYAGICGFTLEDFDLLFADRLESILGRLKAKGKMKTADQTADLKEKIYKWYDGYNWGGDTRILNPFSILNFFKKESFGGYWILSGRPKHLTAMIKANPSNFFQPKLESYLSDELKKSDLKELEAVPVLFHSGYLTLDKAKTQGENSQAEETENGDSYTLRLPNYEVASSYYKDCFRVIWGLKSIDNLAANSPKLKDDRRPHGQRPRASRGFPFEKRRDGQLHDKGPFISRLLSP
jgi:hypothetical protein